MPRRMWCQSSGAVSTACIDSAVVNIALEKYDNEAHKFWDKFYQNNTTHFFKDRHWLTREFPELLAAGAKLLEVGCGVGNTIFPLLQENSTLYVYGIDFSQKAISLVKVSPGKISSFAFPLHTAGKRSVFEDQMSGICMRH